MGKSTLGCRWIAGAFATRRKYRSLWDALKIVKLQMALTGLGKSCLAERDVSICMRGLPQPVILRQTKFDVYALLEIFLWGEYAYLDPNDLPEDARIVDLGANIGLASLYFSTLRPTARFLAVEPAADNCRMLRTNCRHLIQTGQMEVVEAFVASHEGTASLDRSRGSLGYRMAAESATAVASEPDSAIACVAIDKLVSQFLGDDGAGLDLLKCDIEGAERELFSDCAGWIGRVSQLVVETHAPYKLGDLYEDLRRNGWSFEIRHEATKSTPAGMTGTCFLLRSSKVS